MARIAGSRSGPTLTTREEPTHTPIQHPALLDKRHRSPDDEPTPVSKKRKLSLYNPSLRESWRVLLRPQKKLPTTPLRAIKFRPHSLLLNAILSNTERTLVLLVSLRGEYRVLKLYPPRSNNHRWCFAHEYDAYAVLENTHYSGSVAPRCYGCIDPIDVDNLLDAFHNLTWKETTGLQSTHFARACPKGTPGTALLIQHIPGESALNRMVTDDIIKKAEDGLEDLHRRGVVHGDPAPRNLMITEDNNIIWIDYDLSVTTRSAEIEDGRFFSEFTTMRREFGVN